LGHVAEHADPAEAGGIAQGSGPDSRIAATSARPSAEGDYAFDAVAATPRNFPQHAQPGQPVWREVLLLHLFHAVIAHDRFHAGLLAAGVRAKVFAQLQLCARLHAAARTRRVKAELLAPGFLAHARVQAELLPTRFLAHACAPAELFRAVFIADNRAGVALPIGIRAKSETLVISPVARR